MSKSLEKIHKEIEKASQKRTEDRVKDLIPVVKLIIAVIASADLPLGKLQSEYDNKEFVKTIEKVIDILADNNVRYSDISLIGPLVLEPFDAVMNHPLRGVKHSISKVFDRAEEKAFKKNFLELTLKDLLDMIND